MDKKIDCLEIKFWQENDFEQLPVGWYLQLKILQQTFARRPQSAGQLRFIQQIFL